MAFRNADRGQRSGFSNSVRYLGASSCAFLMNSDRAASSSLGARVVRDATAMPTWAKNSSCPAGAQMQSSRTVCFEALVKECGALAGMFTGLPERPHHFLPREV